MTKEIFLEVVTSLTKEIERLEKDIMEWEDANRLTVSEHYEKEKDWRSEKLFMEQKILKLEKELKSDGTK